MTAPQKEVDAFEVYWHEYGTALLTSVKTYSPSEVLMIAKDAAESAWLMRAAEPST